MSNWFQDLYNKFWVKLLTALTGITTLLGLGFGVGKFSEGVNCNLEKIKLTQEFNEKINQEKDKCRDSEIAKYGSAVERIERAVKEIGIKETSKKDEK